MAIPASAPLALPLGSSITALGERGKIILNGAFEGSMASVPIPDPRSSDPPFGILTSLLMRVLIFVERGTSEEGADLWSIRPDTPGTKCMIAGRAPRLQVSDAILGRTATIVNSHDAFATLVLASKSLEWPTGLPFEVGTEYRVWQLAIVDGTGFADERLSITHNLSADDSAQLDVREAR
jgi:hypothetical protein